MTYLQPLLGFFILLSLIGLIRLRRRKRSRLAWVGIGGILAISWPPIDWVLSRPLEMGYPIRPFPSGTAEAIVVLSAGVLPPDYERPYALLDEESFTRVEHAVWLYHRWRPLPVLACGGVPEGEHAPPFSAAMRDQIEHSGVPANMIWTEDRSRSTHENALYGAEILRAHGVGRIALVVDAKSMPRASACFRKLGIAVVPAPCDFRQWNSFLEDALPSWKAIRRNEDMLHETLGLAWYWLRGWI